MISALFVPHELTRYKFHRIGFHGASILGLLIHAVLSKNAGLPGVVPKALGLIHARAAWDVNYAKRLVFNHFQLEGMASSDSDHKEILEMVKLCLQSFAEELEDAFSPSSSDWEMLEKLASL